MADQLSFGLFGIRSEASERVAARLGVALGSLGRQKTTRRIPKYLMPDFQVIRETVAEEEARFVRTMKERMVAIDPEAEGFQPHAKDAAKRKALVTAFKTDSFLAFLSEELVKDVAELLRIQVSPAQIGERGAFLLRTFPAAMAFHRNMYVDAVNGNDFELTKHRNSIWDYRLCFCASPFADVGGLPLLVVTGDGKIRKAAKEAGHADCTITLDEYEALLAGDGVAERADRIRQLAGKT